MVEALAFDLTVSQDGFRLEARAEVPLSGITAISGPSGAGKTTLLRALAGLVAADGPVRLAGREWTGLRAHERRIGFVFQEPRLFPHIDVAGNLGYGARRRGVPDIAPIAARFGLEGLLRRRVTTLSGGEARRVALARAVASGPEILFLDEPLTGLDGARRDEVLALIAQTLGTVGMPALYVTHDPAEIAAVADRVLLVEAGRVTGWGPSPQRLVLVQEGVRAGRLRLRLGAAVLEIGWAGPPGADGLPWRLPLPEGRAVLAPLPDGPTSAAVLSLDRVRRLGERRVAAEIDDQAVELPVPEDFFLPDCQMALLLAEPRPLPMAPIRP